MSSTANLVSQQRSLSRLHDADRVSAVLEHVFGNDYVLNSFLIDERGFHVSSAVIPGWDATDRIDERSATEFGVRIIDWLDKLSAKSKREICQTGPTPRAKLDCWTAFEDRIDGYEVLTFIPGWSPRSSR